MVIARAPVRISFGGGGTDLAAYYESHDGFVVSSAITRYASVAARPSSDGSTRIHSADFALSEVCPPGEAPRIAPPLALPKAALAACAARGLPLGAVELWLSADVPPGTGLGSSSAMAVALVTALHAHCGAPLAPATAAELACEIEIGLLDRPIGKQDQYASAIGGLNAITFARHSVEAMPLQAPRWLAAQLCDNLLLFATGAARDSADVLGHQRAATRDDPTVVARLHRMKALAHEMRAALETGDLDRFGCLLDRGWQEKRALSARISTARIDAYYAAARAAGALGGKVTGAGGGGYLLLYSPLERQRAVRAAMRNLSIVELTFDFDWLGARVTSDDRHATWAADALAIGV